MKEAPRVDPAAKPVSTAIGCCFTVVASRQALRAAQTPACLTVLTGKPGFCTSFLSSPVTPHTMPKHVLRRLEPGEHAAALATLVDSFMALDFSRWITPDDVERAASLSEMFSAILSRPEAEVLVEVTSDLSGVAVWEKPLPSPGRSTEEPTAPVASAETNLDLERDPKAEHEATVARFFSAIDAASPDRERYWYLAFLASRGGGAGAALLKHRLEQLAATAEPMCLFTPAVNVPYYEHMGLCISSIVEAEGQRVWWFVGEPAVVVHGRPG